MSLASLEIDNTSLKKLLDWMQTGIPLAMESRVLPKALNRANRKVLQRVRQKWPFREPSPAKGSRLSRPRKNRRTGAWQARLNIATNAKGDQDSEASRFVYIAKGERGAKKGKRSYVPTALEYGHKGPGGKGTPTPAHPFLRPAVDEMQGQWQQELETAIREELKKAGI